MTDPIDGIERPPHHVARPLVLDAAMGTRLMELGLDLRVDRPVLWNLSRPEAVLSIHRQDVAAGADALTSNTFGADPRELAARFPSIRHRELLRSGVRLAREAAGRGRIVLGSLSPMSDPPGAADAYRRSAEILLDEDVDGLVLETHSPDQAVVALDALAQVGRIPVYVMLFTEPDLTTLRRIEGFGPAALGLNCVSGMPRTIDALTRMRRAGCTLPFLAKPSAGLPGEELATPASFAAAVPRLIEQGVLLLGGCCGTSSAHVAALRQALDRLIGGRVGPSGDTLGPETALSHPGPGISCPPG